MKFAVVDLETTGALPSRDRIIEIGIVIIHDGKIVDTFDSLVNPERSIPPFIARMTGISNEKAEKAPKFFEIARDIVLKLKGHIFVAHNVNFDYNFLKYEFKQLGFSFNSRRLCTVQLSRRLYPEYKSHGLSTLVKRFNLYMSDRHRALGDARATAEFLLRSFDEKTSTKEEVKNLVNFGLQTARLPENISIEFLHDLPEKSGVYFMLDEQGNYAYIGKSDNIKRRIFEHFAKTGRKKERLLRTIRSIEYEITAGNLIALLKEDHYIKKYNPPINVAQKRNTFPYVIAKHTKKEKKYFKVHTHSRAEKQNWPIIAEFGQRKHAYAHIDNSAKEIGICSCMLQEKSHSACWQRQTGSCRGLEIDEEKIRTFEKSISQYFSKDQIIWETLPDGEKVGFVKIEAGFCSAYGEISKEESIGSCEDLEHHAKPYNGTYYTNKVLFKELSMHSKKYRITSI